MLSEIYTTSTLLIDNSTLNSSFTNNLGSAENTALLNSYVVRSISKKDQELIATQTISKDTRILSEKSIFTVSEKENNFDLVNQKIVNKLKRVSKHNQRVFLSFHNNFQDFLNLFFDIVKINILPLDSGATESGLFLEISKINYACLSNCQHT